MLWILNHPKGQPQRFGLGEVIEHDAAPARGVAVAPEVEVVHRRSVAGRWLMARAPRGHLARNLVFLAEPATNEVVEVYSYAEDVGFKLQDPIGLFNLSLSVLKCRKGRRP